MYDASVIPKPARASQPLPPKRDERERGTGALTQSREEEHADERKHEPAPVPQHPDAPPHDRVPERHLHTHRPVNVNPIPSRAREKQTNAKTHVNSERDRPRALLRKVPRRRDRHELADVRDRRAVRRELRPLLRRQDQEAVEGRDEGERRGDVGAEVVEGAELAGEDGCPVDEGEEVHEEGDGEEG